LHILHHGMPFCSMALAALVSLAAVTPTRGQANPPVEYQVKAAFLFNFAKFIEWPSDTFKSEQSAINLCVFRHDPFGSALDEIIRGKVINNRAVLSRRISGLSDLKSCQLVFISSVEDKHLSEVIDSLKGTSALLVGEGEGFAERGGGIQLFQEDSKLRFAINPEAIQRARLTVSSKLLALAKIVQDQGHTKGN
jgi:YfiR/HmsC-like